MIAHAKTLLDTGHLPEALAEAKQEVKDHPTDLQVRTLLFELLSLTGDWEGGRRQLDVIARQDQQAALVVDVYQQLLKAEQDRQRVLTESGDVQFLGSEPSYGTCHRDALKCLLEGHAEDAQRLLAQAEEQYPSTRATVDGEECAEFVDGDDRIGPFLEAVVHGRYTWISFDQIRRFRIPEPKHLRDLVWLPVEIDALDGPLGSAFIPVLYAGSCRSEDERIRLGKMTRWDSVGGEIVAGLGQRMFLVDGADRGMLSLRDVVFEPTFSVRGEE